MVTSADIGLPELDAGLGALAGGGVLEVDGDAVFVPSPLEVTR
jgi:hypothetical protein